jgi:hypothetical protein
MNENAMVNCLGAILDDASASGHDLGHSRSFFEAGKWLPALVEAEGIPDQNIQIRNVEEFHNIREFMGNPSDPYQ